MRTLYVVLLTIVFSLSTALYAANHLTVYHANFGLINETLDLTLDKGINEFLYRNIPTGIYDSSIILNPLKTGDFRIHSQSFFNEKKSFAGILRDLLGKEIEIITSDGSILSGTLFFLEHDMIGLKEINRDRTFFIRTNEIRNYIVKSDHYQYQEQPYIAWKLISEKGGKIPARLSYITDGLSWSAMYTAVWNDDSLNLDIMAVINNNSGVDYHDFNISLVAGDPKKISGQITPRMYHKARDSYMMAESLSYSPEPGFVSEEVDDYYVYRYSEKISLQKAENKQIRLFPRKTVQPEVYYEYLTNSKQVLIRLKTVNDQKSGLGIQLPRGIIQIYRQNSEQGLDFVGEDRVEQQPVNEEWIISPGIAFDLIAETITVDTRRPARNITENDMLVRVRNRSNESKTVYVTHFIRGNWTLQNQSRHHERLDAARIQFKKELRANEEYEFTWTERIEH